MLSEQAGGSGGGSAGSAVRVALLGGAASAAMAAEELAALQLDPPSDAMPELQQLRGLDQVQQGCCACWTEAVCRRSAVVSRCVDHAWQDAPADASPFWVHIGCALALYCAASMAGSNARVLQCCLSCIALVQLMPADGRPLVSQRAWNPACAPDAHHRSTIPLQSPHSCKSGASCTLPSMRWWRRRRWCPRRLPCSMRCLPASRSRCMPVGVPPRQGP